MYPNIYIKTTGANRYAGGSHNRLKIRGLEKTKTGYTIKVRIDLWAIVSSA